VTVNCKSIVWALAAVIACLTLQGCAGAHFRAAAPGACDHAPLDPSTLGSLEYHTGIVFNGSKIGFSSLSMRRARGGEGLFEIRSLAAFAFRFLMVDKKFSLKAYDLVDENLALVEFSYDYDLDGNVMHLEGRLQDGSLLTRVVTHGKVEEKVFAACGPVYPTSVLYLYPAFRGLATGKVYEMTVYDGETRSVSPARLEVLACEESDLFEGAGFKVRVQLHSQEATAWIDRLGRPLLETAMGGVLVSGLEDDRRAREYLARTSLNKGDALLEMSLVPTVTKIDRPREAETMEVVLVGVDSALSIPSDCRQVCTRQADGVHCRIERDAAPCPCGGKDDREGGGSLRPSLEVQSGDARISALAESISAGRKGAREVASAVVAWMGANIRKEAIDVFSALDVLERKKAECQGHALLYAALARASGIPTKVVSGLVYSAEHGGFLYHAWAESCLDGAWVAVDPTFGQLPADATHVKLVEGESPGDLIALAGFVGRISAGVLSCTYGGPEP